MDRNEPNTVDCRNTSASDAPGGETGLMRVLLAKAGKLRGGETDGEIAEAYRQWRDERDQAAAEREERRRTEAEDQANELLRKTVLATGIQAQTMTPAQLREHSTEINRRRHEESVAAEERRRAAAEQAAKEAALREAHAHREQLFAAAGCPLLHVQHLDRIDASTPARWRETLDELYQQAIYAAGYIAALIGPRGCGKTQLAIAAIHRLCGDGFSCRYTRAADLFRSYRAAYDTRWLTEAKVSQRWASFDFLVIDEVHEVGDTDAERRTLTNLIDTRYGHRACTLMIGNLSKSEFAAAVGDSIVSRMHEAGVVLECNGWPSFRKPGHWRQGAGAPLRVPSEALHGGSAAEGAGPPADARVRPRSPTPSACHLGRAHRDAEVAK